MRPFRSEKPRGKAEGWLVGSVATIMQRMTGLKIFVASLAIVSVDARAQPAPVPQPRPSPSVHVPEPPQAPKPAHTKSPYIGSPEWDKQEADKAKSEARLLKIMKGVCRGC
jgi:hypothetical protein